MNYRNYNDYEILYLIGENDDQAREILYQKYRPIIKAIASKYYKAAKQRGLEMEDLIQEGYIGFDRAIQKYDNTNSLFYTFCSICIERQILSVVRRASTKKNELLNQALSYDIVYPDSEYLVAESFVGPKDEEPEDKMLQRETEQKLRRFQYDLDLIPACVFELRYNGFSYQEIATLLDISVRRVDSYLFRIRQKLKEII